MHLGFLIGTRFKSHKMMQDEGIVMSSELRISGLQVPSEFEDDGAWNWGDSAAVIFILFFGLLLTSSTAYDLWYQFYKKESAPHMALKSFSVWTNSKKVFTPSLSPGPLSCFYGIRMLSLLWVIVGHRYLLTLIYPVGNIQDVKEWINSYSSMAILTGALSVDSFFLLSGILVSYVFFRKMGNQSTFSVAMHYAHRVLRLAPALAAAVLLQATLCRLATDPADPLRANSLQVRACRRNWWSTLLFIQNYANPEEICLGQTWYLAVDMQLYILSPLLLYPMLKKPKLGLALASFSAIASVCVLFAVCYAQAWPAAVIPRDEHVEEDRQIHYYYPTHTRATPWLIGVIAGYYLQTTVNKRIVVNKYLVSLGWAASLAVMGAVVLGMHPLQSPDHMFSYEQDTTYLAFSGLAWTLAVLWVIVACAHGYGGPINWFLSWRIWELLSRFSYCMYLAHLSIQNIINNERTKVMLFSNSNIVYNCVRDTAVTFLVAYALVITFETPVVLLEKIIFVETEAKPLFDTDRYVADEGNSPTDNSASSREVV